MSAPVSPAEWAGTREYMYDLHRFTTDKRARCNREIRTYSVNTTPVGDQAREPYARLRGREEIEADGFAMDRFCRACAEGTS